MEDKKEIFAEMAVLVQRKYTQLLEIDKLTTELADVLARDDRDSAQLLLGMRQNEMDEANKLEGHIRAILDAVDTKSRVDLKSLLNGEVSEKPEDFESGKILELSGMIKKTLAHTISVDKVVSRKLAGKDSYYAVKE